MEIRDALKSYFERLEFLYKEKFGTLPTVSWSAKLSQDLFVGTPDEDDEIQWKAKPAIPIHVPGLCQNLADFYGAFYYWELRGTLSEVYYCFPAVPTYSDSKKVATIALSEGNYYFPNQNTALLANCSVNGNDDILLFYRQNTGELFLYDVDQRTDSNLGFSLTTLINSMKAVI